MTVFKRGPKNADGFDGKPMTGGQPEGGYGSAGAPSRAQRYSAKKGKPSGSYGSAGMPAANKPSGGHGSYGKPKGKKSLMSKGQQPMGSYGSDGMAEPKTPIPADQATGRFNLPKGKFV